MSTAIKFKAVEASPQELEIAFIDYMFKGAGGVTRRIGFGALKNSSQYLEAVEQLDHYIKMLQSHKEMMEASRARIFAVLEYHFGETANTAN